MNEQPPANNWNWMPAMSPLKIIAIVIYIFSWFFAITTGVYTDPTFLMIAAFATLSVLGGVIP